MGFFVLVVGGVTAQGYNPLNLNLTDNQTAQDNISQDNSTQSTNGDTNMVDDKNTNNSETQKTVSSKGWTKDDLKNSDKMQNYIDSQDGSPAPVTTTDGQTVAITGGNTNTPKGEPASPTRPNQR
jgi:hypothetical protein